MARIHLPLLFNARHVEQAAQHGFRSIIDPPPAAVGLDPGSKSAQVAIAGRLMSPRHLHVTRVVQHFRTEACVSVLRVITGDMPAPISVFTEAAAFAIPAGHSTSVARDLEADGYTTRYCSVRPRDRIQAIRLALDPGDDRWRLTIQPSCPMLLDVLRRSRGITPLGRTTAVEGTMDPHWLDALGYLICGAFSIPSA